MHAQPAPASTQDQQSHNPCCDLLISGVDSFINSFENATAVELDGATLRLLTAADVYGLGLASMSALHVSEPTGPELDCLCSMRLWNCREPVKQLLQLRVR